MGSLPKQSILKGALKALDINTNLVQLFRLASEQHPNAVALQFKDVNGCTHILTYADLDKLSSQYATIMQQESSIHNSSRIVAVQMYPSEQLIAVLLAIWKIGAAYLPLDHAFPASRVKHILSEAKPDFVITDSKEKLADYPTITLSQLIEQAPRTPTISDQYESTDIAIVLYTSGSTGVPKGVRLSHCVILNRLQWQFDTFPYGSSEKYCVFKTALTFVDSVAEIWGPLLNGRTLLIIPKHITQDPEQLIQLLSENNIERLVLVPSLLNAILLFMEMQRKTHLLTRLRLWVCSGETLPSSLAIKFLEVFPDAKLCNFYGSTEIMGDVSYHVVNKANPPVKNEKIPIGVPIINTILYLLDPLTLQPVDVGQVGELFVAGANVAAGYIQNRDPHRFIANPHSSDSIFERLFRTGDFAKVNHKGFLEYEGRMDSQVKIRGHRVDLTEIESTINLLNGVEKGVVLCYKSSELEQQTILAFIKHADRSMTELMMEKILENHLVSYMLPQVILVDEIPLLVNGKVDRQSLLRLYENMNNNDDDGSVDVEMDFSGVSEDDKELATILFETVAEVLQRNSRSAISLQANFFSIGGNSLNSILTISLLNRKGYAISVNGFLKARSLADILCLMRASKAASAHQHAISSDEPPAVRFRGEILQERHKNDVIEMITTSFFEKADLERWLMPHIIPANYSELMLVLWPHLLERGLSVVAIDIETNRCIGVALNFDAHDEPAVHITSKLNIIFDFLEAVEAPIRDHSDLPRAKGKVLHSFMMATHSSLSAQENVAVIEFLEHEVLKVGRLRKFEGILTTNTSPLTQQLCSDVFHYRTLLDYQVNKYIADDKTRPFKKAPDSQRAKVQWKLISAA